MFTSSVCGNFITLWHKLKGTGRHTVTCAVQHDHGQRKRQGLNTQGSNKGMENRRETAGTKRDREEAKALST